MFQAMRRKSIHDLAFKVSFIKRSRGSSYGRQVNIYIGQNPKVPHPWPYLYSGSQSPFTSARLPLHVEFESVHDNGMHMSGS